MKVRGPELRTVPSRDHRAPSRPGRDGPWQLNYRFRSAAGMQDWSYWLGTFNIAYGPANTEVFLSTPTVFVDEQGPLR
jgi:hypothetical protein